MSITASMPQQPAINPRDLLAIAPASITTLLQALPPHALHCADGDGRWTMHDVLAHLVDLEESDRGWLPRIRHVLEALPGPLPRVDAARHLPTYSACPVSTLIARFWQGRIANLERLDSLRLDAAALGRVGQHPDLGPLTAGNLVMAWAMHDLDHLAQIAGIIGHHQAAAVGPIATYLRICRPRSPA